MRALQTAIAACYGRPFTEGTMIQRLDKGKWVPSGADHELHEHLMTLRHKTYAHTDIESAVVPVAAKSHLRGRRPHHLLRGLVGVSARVDPASRRPLPSSGAAVPRRSSEDRRRALAGVAGRAAIRTPERSIRGRGVGSNSRRASGASVRCCGPRSRNSRAVAVSCAVCASSAASF
jgi:hypothetical protein